jgi:epoxyqueuosine reductase
MLSSLTVKERALDLGFDLAGIAPIGVWKDLEFSRQWVEKGFNGEMRYLENPKRFDPRLILPSAKSAICVGLVYNTPLPYSSFHFPVSAAATPRAWISRYAWGHDYHEIMWAKLDQLRAALEELAPGVETRVFVDAGPVVERAFARFSGIGWMGKNTCIINQEKGSWFFLGVILTSLELAPDLPAPDRCGSCTACLDACPTGALVEPYVMDASRCISYFSIELKGSIPVQFRPKIGANVFGCDICQDVCPWNSGPSRQLSRHGGVGGQPQNNSHQPSANSYQQSLSRQRQSPDERCVKQAATTKVPQFHPIPAATIHPTLEDGGVLKQLTTDHGPLTTNNASLSLFNPPLDVLALISEDDFRRIFAHSPIKRAKYRAWLRNLCVAMGNSGDERFLPWLEQAAQHSDPIVREHATWALERLRNK